MSEVRVVSLDGTEGITDSIEREISDNINTLTMTNKRVVSISPINHKGTTTHVVIVFEDA
jgi:hypothetical protein